MDEIKHYWDRNRCPPRTSTFAVVRNIKLKDVDQEQAALPWGVFCSNQAWGKYNRFNFIHFRFEYKFLHAITRKRIDQGFCILLRKSLVFFYFNGFSIKYFNGIVPIS
jgi:hypothetical protein